MKVQVSILATVVFVLFFSQKSTAQVDGGQLDLGGSAFSLSARSDVQSGKEQNGKLFAPSIRLRTGIFWAQYSFSATGWGDTIVQRRSNPTEWYTRRGQYHIMSLGLQTDPDFTLGSSDIVLEGALGFTAMNTAAIIKTYKDAPNVFGATSGWSYGVNPQVRIGGDMWKLQLDYRYLWCQNDTMWDRLPGGEFKQDRVGILSLSLFIRTAGW